MQKLLSGRHWRGGTIGQRHFTGLLKEEHDLNTVISGWNRGGRVQRKSNWWLRTKWPSIKTGGGGKRTFPGCGSGFGFVGLGFERRMLYV